MRFRGGEFSTGTTGNFQPELTMALPTYFLLPRNHGSWSSSEAKWLRYSTNFETMRVNLLSVSGPGTRSSCAKHTFFFYYP
jgi:hypothetical protein